MDERVSGVLKLAAKLIPLNLAILKILVLKIIDLALEIVNSFIELEDDVPH
jgi:hypothetical protein